ncbi:hypothetical protein HYDPIDRAFT_30288 [Hydnomerulius pinastri MD-312]|uniref:DUF6533 domain-containing protein n=1 Tax=Hydnomerulius pinastri MD-312 TaxID=994086 RepID=A0A0C9WD41_9AGAM|nr:hypothetical protein HYDPIDRAFT_30288 [Hydnomerulius pinastri MD-312]
MSESKIQDEYLNTVEIIQVFRMSQLAPYIVIVYDHILNFDQEVEHIWKRSRSLSTVLYVILRYGGTAAALLNVFFILQVRLYALYNCSKKLLFSVGGAYIAEIVAMSTILGMANATDTVASELLPGVFICIGIADLMNRPIFFYSFWLLLVTFESILFLLAVRFGVQRSNEYCRPMSASGRHLGGVVVMGNAVYFVGILSTFVVNIVVRQKYGFQWPEVPEGLPQAIGVVGGCRLILHIRRAACRDVYVTTTRPTQVLQIAMQPFTPSPALHEA